MSLRIREESAMSMVGEQNEPQSEFNRAVKVVEAVLSGLGLDPNQSRLATTDGSTAFTLLRGSAEVLVFLSPAKNDGPNFIRIISPIWRLPTENQPAVLRKLLEMNARDLFGTAFGLMGDDTVLVSERSTKDMERSEVEEILQNIGAAADYFDDWLVQQFGGTRLSDLRAT